MVSNKIVKPCAKNESTWVKIGALKGAQKAPQNFPKECCGPCTIANRITFFPVRQSSHALVIEMNLHHKRPFKHGQSMNSKHIKSSDRHLKNAISDVKTLSNVDVGSAEVDVTEVIVEGMPREAGEQPFIPASKFLITLSTFCLYLTLF